MKIFFVILGVLCAILLLMIFIAENTWYLVSNPFRKEKKKIMWFIARDIDSVIELDDFEQRIS